MLDSDMAAFLGEPLLAYLLGVNVEELGSVRADPSDKQVVTLDLLTSIAAQLPTKSIERRVQLENWLGQSPDGTHTIANLLRLQSGAELPAYEASKDPLVNAYGPLVVACYPLLLLPDAQDWPGSSVSLASISFHTPQRPAIETAIWQDPVLNQLFPDTGDSMTSVAHTTRAQSGGSIQLTVFLGQAISHAWQECRIAHPVPTVQQVMDRIASNLTLLRRATAGKPTTTTAIVGFTGVLLPDGVDEIDLPMARIRRVSNGHRWLTRHTGMAGKLTRTTEQGDTIEIDYSGDVVAEIEVPYKLLIGERSFEEEWPAELTAVSHSIASTIETLRAALVLALDEPEPVNMAVAWQVLFDPLAHGISPAWNDARTLPNITPRLLTPKNCDDWQELAVPVETHRRHISIALRRLLGAVGSRHSPDDALVDAIIVWENLFGASTETTLRVCASMAWLLGTDAADRKTRFQQYKKLYGTRSDLVHGNVRAEKLQPGDLHNQARQAVQVAIAALRRLFLERTDLLAIAKSEDRSIAVLMNEALMSEAPDNADLDRDTSKS